MPHFGKASMIRRATCHQDHIIILDDLIKKMDFTILCSHRTKEEQDKAVANGFSKVNWPNSKHNTLPSLAVDIAPYYKDKPHIRWPDKKLRPRTYDKELAAFYMLSVAYKLTGEKFGIEIRSGFDWDGDWDILDQTFDDLPHHELILKKII